MQPNHGEKNITEIQFPLLRYNKAKWFSNMTRGKQKRTEVAELPYECVSVVFAKGIAIICKNSCTWCTVIYSASFFNWW